MNVLKPGTYVAVREYKDKSRIEAQVLQVCIKRDGITYQLAYWDGNSRKTEWFEEFEITLLQHTKTEQIGFAK